MFILSPVEFGSFHGVFVPNDLRVYLEAAERLSHHEDLYILGTSSDLYQYAPGFALLFTPLLHIYPTTIVIAATILYAIAYVFLYVSWDRIFRWVNVPLGGLALAWTIPLWIVFEPLWGDLTYLNVYILIALIATCLIEAILREDWFMSLLWVSILLQAKPFWIFPIGVSFILGKRKFFWKLLGSAVVVYLVITGLTILVLGLDYGLAQYSAYYKFIISLSSNFPWRGPDTAFLGYNHSVAQVILHIVGMSKPAMKIVIIAKTALLVPLGIVAFRWFFRSGDFPVPDLVKLEMAFVLYLAAFIWLDIVWELTLGLAIFALLRCICETRLERVIAGIVVIPYALLDMWRLLSYLIGGDKVLKGAYVLTDPSAYIPMILIVILVFYALLLRKLWTAKDLAG
ncbi:MAG: DUF2029 domain-containing protein [Anaerolineales bacterium]|nr:DUF2029 domain-containing protein [Anaerolineales bacterium]